jgi:phosphotransferase system IIA component
MDLDDDILIHLNIPCVYMNECNFKAQSVRGRMVKTGFKTVTGYDFLVQHSA